MHIFKNIVIIVPNICFVLFLFIENIYDIFIVNLFLNDLLSIEATWLCQKLWLFELLVNTVIIFAEDAVHCHKCITPRVVDDKIEAQSVLAAQGHRWSVEEP